MDYPYYQAANDYGPRKSTTALVLHMTEGNGNMSDVLYLMRQPARGVSANFVSIDTGIVRMLPWGHTSGSLNPSDRASYLKGFYGSKYLEEALPSPLWQDPNVHVISMEIGGKAVNGPTDKQVDEIIAWGRDMIDMFPTITGIFGHADQTNTKGCPGVTPNMRRIFDALGHGKVNMAQAPITSTIPALIDAPVGRQIYDLDGVTKVAVTTDARVGAYSAYAVKNMRSTYYGPSTNRKIGLLVPTAVHPIVVPDKDCSTEIAAAIAVDRGKAHIVYS